MYYVIFGCIFHMIPMPCKCTWHNNCEVWPKGFRVMPLFSKFLYINISVFSCHKAGIGSIRISISDSLQLLYHSIVYTLKSEETEDHLRDSLSHANREREELIDRLSYFQNKVKSQQEDIRSVLYPRGNNSLLFSSFF